MKRCRLFILSVFLLACCPWGCGRAPAGGQQGELCGADSDCSAGAVCESQVCQFMAGRDAGADTSVRGGSFFAVLRFTMWTGTNIDNQLQELGQFISDLSTILAPYYAAHAANESQLRFGLADRDARPLALSIDNTITLLTMQRTGIAFVASQDAFLLPVFYSDDTVQLAFDMPLTDINLRLEFPNLTVGEVGSLVFRGALRSEDAQALVVFQGGQQFTLFDVLRGVPFDVDTNLDSVFDAWLVSWRGEAELR